MGDHDEKQQEEWKKKFRKDLRGFGRDFSKTGTFGKIPEPVDKWSRALGGTPKPNEIILIDSAGKAIEIKNVRQWCTKEYWLTSRYQEAAVKDCSQNFDFAPAAANAEDTLLNAAEPLLKKCEEEGCIPLAQLEWEWWFCTTEASKQVVEVEIVIAISCNQF